MTATPTSRQPLYILVALVAALAVVLYVRFGRSAADAPPAVPAGTASQPSNQAAAAKGRAGLPVSDVRLDALKHEGSKVEETDRNPFRFKPKAPPPPPPQAARPTPPPVFAPPVAQGPPPPPPIPLKYIGWLNPDTRSRIAVLADARGNPFYGKEGELIEGRYRVLRIAADSVDLAYADGRGRQTLRLSPQ
jgi:hypothetical protein